MRNRRVMIAIGAIILFSLAAGMYMVIGSYRTLGPPPEPGVFLIRDDGYEKTLASSGPPAENAIFPVVDHANPEIAFWRARTSFARLAFGTLDDMRSNPTLNSAYTDERLVTSDGVIIFSFAEPLPDDVYCFVQLGQPRPFEYYCFKVLR